MEEDVGLEPLAASVSAGLLHEQLDAAVDALRQGVAEAVLEEGPSGFSVGFFIGSYGRRRYPKRSECTSMCTSTDPFANPTRTLSIPEPRGAPPAG